MVISDAPRVTGSMGGQPKQTYWTPDGRQMRVMPDIHTFVRQNNKGAIVEEGIRDANLDKGWLVAQPTELKLYCPNCDLWHDTKKEIVSCKQKQKSLVEKSLLRARKDPSDKDVAGLDNDRIKILEDDMVEIKRMLKQLLKGVD